MKTNRLLMSCVVLTSALAGASGFNLDTQGARASGMGAAVAALTDDATALYYNPAGLAGRQGFEAQLGASLIIPSVSFASDASGQSTSANAEVATPFNLYATYGFTKDISVGVGVFVPFGAGASWPDGWEGAGRALLSSVQTFDLNPTVAFRLHPRLKFGVGVDIVYGTVLIERGLDFVSSQGKVKLGGDGTGVGWNMGFQLEVIENRLFLGGSYRAAVPLHFAGRAHFADVPAEFQSVLKDQPITADVTLPDVATVGLGIKPTDKLRLGVDVTAVTWGSFRNLTIAFEDDSLTNPLPKNWTDVASIHLGGEYDVTQDIQARVGFVYDPTGTPENTVTPDLPDFTRVKVTLGGGWKSDFGLSADLAYQLVFLQSQKSTAPGFSGTYSGMAHVVSLNVGYKL
jgi:long-chain fatty acid transport protein